MALSYGKSSPQDILEKARRDLNRLDAAHNAQDEGAGSDALFDFAVTLTSLKDWLKEHPGRSFTSREVESLVTFSVALSSFRDIANGGKHRVIRNYAPVTDDVSASATPSMQVIASFTDDENPPPVYEPKPIRHLKIIRVDGSRHRAVELGRNAIREWEAFIQQHGV